MNVELHAIEAQELILSSYHVMLLIYHGPYLHHAHVEGNA
jgi:hypothetical protein